MSDFEPAAGIEDAIREFHELTDHNRALYAEAEHAHEVAARFRGQYRSVVEAPGNDKWLDVDAALDAAVPELPVEEPADLGAEARAFEGSLDAGCAEGCDPASQDCPWYRELVLGGAALPRTEKEQADIYARIAAEQRTAKQLAKSIDDCYRVAKRYKEAFEELSGSKHYQNWEKRQTRRGAKPPSFEGEALERKNPTTLPGIAVKEEAARLEALGNEPASAEAPSYYEPAKARVGIIATSADWLRYKDAADCVRVFPRKAEEGLSKDLDLLLVFSVDAKSVEATTRAARLAKERGLPVAFVGSGDPAARTRCLPIAREATLVFTVDEASAARYERELGIEGVRVLGPAFNPRLHHPAGRAEATQSDDVLLACGWPAGRGRAAKAAEAVADGVLSAGAGLVAVDGFPGGLPAKYAAHRVDAMKPAQLGAAERSFRFAACVDGPQTSASALSARAVELQAAGCLVLTSYSLAASNEAPEMFTVLDSEEVAHILSGYTDDELLALSAEGVRHAFDGNTAYERMDEVLAAAGLQEAPEKPAVHVIVDEVDEEAQAFLASQSLAGARLVAAADAASLKEGFAVRVSRPWPESPWLLEDLLDAFKYTDADWSAAAPSPELAWGWAEGAAPQGPAMADLSKVPVSALLSGAMPEGSRGFFVPAPRWGRDTSASPKELSVIMPIHNNGQFLWRRSFRSLLRSSAFDRMQVYLMDDGSTDGRTDRVVSWIADRYDNVTPFLFGDGGSGSPSRPRNKGLELSRETYITYLDPDNEAVGDGYAKLLDEARSSGADLVYGRWLRVNAKAEVKRFAFGRDGERAVEDPNAELIDAGFSFLNPQSCVVKRDLMREAGLSFMGGTVGEDTLFGYELLLAAHDIRRREVDASAYWADREGSLTNSIGADFFRRALLCHERQAQMLRERGLIEDYRERHLRDEVDGWLRSLLSRVPIEELPEAAGYVRDVKSLYME